MILAVGDRQAGPPGCPTGREMRFQYGPKPRNGLVAKPEWALQVPVRDVENEAPAGAAGVLGLGVPAGNQVTTSSVTSGPASDSPGAHLGQGSGCERAST
jgi:hypothetical protein